MGNYGAYICPDVHASGIPSGNYPGRFPYRRFDYEHNNSHDELLRPHSGFRPEVQRRIRYRHNHSHNAAVFGRFQYILDDTARDMDDSGIADRTRCPASYALKQRKDSGYMKFEFSAG